MTEIERAIEVIGEFERLQGKELISSNWSNQELCDICYDLHMLIKSEENKPLTLEQLENMTGEPIWVHGHYQIIHCVDKENNLIWVCGFGASYKFKNHAFYKYKPKENEQCIKA